MSACFLGLDFGTGGAKCAVVNENGSVLGTSAQEYQIHTRHAGWSEHSADQYWPIACQLFREALDHAGKAAGSVAGIAVSSALPSLVLTGASGEPVADAYNLLDRRAQDQVRRLKHETGEERIFQLSGYPLDDHPVLVNLLWEKEHRPEVFAATRHALTIDGYIVHRLTGEASVHASGAAFFGVAYDVRRGEFSAEMLAEIGIDPSLLPPVFACDAIVGRVTSQAAHESGLRGGTPVAAGQVDCNASWIGAGATEAGDAQVNLGTVGNIGVIFRDLSFAFSDSGRLSINFPYTTPGLYVTVPTTLTGGQTLRYVRDKLSPVERSVEELTGLSAYDLLTREAEQVPPGSEGLVALPYLMGERSPLWDPDARASFVGLSLSHGKGHLVRALMEGVAFALNANYRLLVDAGLPVSSPLILNEGGAVSRLWRRIVTDVLGIPTAMVERRTGAPYGDAILAAVATDHITDFSVTKEWARYVDYMEPDQETHDRYTEYYGVFQRVYKALRPEFKTLANLRDRHES